MSFTTCIGSNNNLPYLKLAVKSVRKNHHHKDAPLIVLAENCVDGTNEWLEENREVYNITPVIVTTLPDAELGIGGGMNAMADMVTTEYIHFMHADMYVAPNQDLHLLEVFDEHPPETKLVVSSYRIQPNIFAGDSDRPGTSLIDDFGQYHSDFDEEYFESWADSFGESNADYRVAKGEGVSFMIKKRDWILSGGNDPRFAPAFWEDMDLFLTMTVKGFVFVLTGRSLVFHFAGRSHNSHHPDDVFKKSERSMQHDLNGARKFYEKWGGSPQFNEVGMIYGVR